MCDPSASGRGGYATATWRRIVVWVFLLGKIKLWVGMAHWWMGCKWRSTLVGRRDAPPPPVVEGDQSILKLAAFFQPKCNAGLLGSTIHFGRWWAGWWLAEVLRAVCVGSRGAPLRERPAMSLLWSGAAVKEYSEWSHSEHLIGNWKHQYWIAFRLVRTPQKMVPCIHFISYLFRHFHSFFIPLKFILEHPLFSHCSYFILSLSLPFTLSIIFQYQIQ